jgi:hypothetical protein
MVVRAAASLATQFAARAVRVMTSRAHDGGAVLREIFAATGANGSVSICNTSRASALIPLYPIYRWVLDDSHSSPFIFYKNVYAGEFSVKNFSIR